MSRFANHIVGFDNSVELLKIAKDQLEKENAKNIDFVYGWTKSENQLPFKDDTFDLIFCRRGPTSILNHPRILKSKGTIIGIHSAEKNRVEERLKENNFTEIEFEIFNQAIAVFPNEGEFIKFLSAFPGSPDYSLPEYSKQINQIIQDNIVDNRLTYKQWRYIWKARKL